MTTKQVYIYLIYCKDNNITDTYIGQTMYVTERFKSHARAYSRIGCSIKKYGGITNWTFKILEICDYELRHIKEHLWIKNLKPSLNKCLV
jgi:hypothetical protein